MDTRRRRERGRPVERAHVGAGEPARDPRTVEIVELGEVAPPRRGPGAQWLGLAGIAVLFGLVVVVGLPGLPSPFDQSATARPTDTARSAPPIVFGTARPDPSPFPWAWTEFELRGYGRGSSVANVWALDGLFVIEVETDEGPDGGPFGPVSSVLLASEDGTTWTDDRVDLPVPGFVVDVGAAAGGWLAVLGRPDGESSRQAWITRDGTWERRADPSSRDLLEGRVDELVVTGCGIDADCDGPGWGAVVGVEDSHEWEDLLLSRDGVDWVRPELPLDGAASLTRLTLTDGTWYVVATRGGADADPPVTDLLSSSDLVTWRAERVAMTRGGGRAMAIGVAGPVVVGSALDGADLRPRAWLRSTDGEWLEVEPPMLAGRAPASMDFVIATSEGYLAMSASTGDAWRSADGVTWANRPAFHAESGDTVRALATSGDVVIAGGRTASGRPAIWHNRALLAARDPVAGDGTLAVRMVTLGSGAGSPGLPSSCCAADHPRARSMTFPQGAAHVRSRGSQETTMKRTYTFGRRLPGTPEDLRPAIEAALKAEGFGVVTEIDVAAVLKAKLGLDLGPYLILGACNPAIAHEALEIDPAVGTLLPCNVVLRAEGDLTVVEAIDPVAAMQIAGSARLGALAMDARERLVRAMRSIRKRPVPVAV